MSKQWYWATIIVGAVFLIQYWLKFLQAFESGHVVAYKNYWGQSAGTYLLLAVLVVATPIYFYVAWKHYPKQRKKGK